MVATINADTTNGVIITSDTSGEIELQANGVTKAKVTANGLQDANGASLRGGSFRNLIINGDMQIAQRGTSFTGVTSGNTFGADRFMWQIGTAGTWTVTQDTDVPTGQGFANSIKLACTTANASLSAGSYGLFLQRFEGQMLQHLKKGTSNAEKVTVSFWIKSNKTGTLQSNLREVNNTRLVGKEFTISSANTWEKKTITYDGDTTGTINNDNASSLQWEIWFVAGSSYSGGSVPTTWEALDNADRYANATINLADSTSNYVNITGVQLEVGSGASDFEFLPYDVQLARCQRYCQVMGGGQFEVMMVGAAASTTVGSLTYKPPVNFRATPSMSYSDIGDFQLYRFTGVTAVAVTSASLVSIISSSQYVYVDWTASAGITTGEVIYLRSDNTTSSKLIFSAEL